MSEIVSLADRRPPVHYTVRLTHHWDGAIEVFVEDVADNLRCRESVGYALALAAERFSPSLFASAKAVHVLALDRINELMPAKAGSPEAVELVRWADAVALYEERRFQAGAV